VDQPEALKSRFWRYQNRHHGFAGTATGASVAPKASASIATLSALQATT
jgi:hypothetical protein